MAKFQRYVGGVLPKQVIGKRFQDISEPSWIEQVVMDLQGAAQSGDVGPRIVGSQWKKEGKEFSFSGSLGNLVTYKVRQAQDNGATFYVADLCVGYNEKVSPIVPGFLMAQFLQKSGVLAISGDSDDFDLYAYDEEGELMSGKELLHEMGLKPRQACKLEPHPGHEGELYWKLVQLE